MALQIDKDTLLKIGQEVAKEIDNSPKGSELSFFGEFLKNLPSSIENVKKITDNLRYVAEIKNSFKQAPVEQQQPYTAPQVNEQLEEIKRATQIKPIVNNLEEKIRFEINDLIITAHKQEAILKSMTAFDFIGLLEATKEDMIKKIVERLNR